MKHLVTAAAIALSAGAATADDAPRPGQLAMELEALDAVILKTTLGLDESHKNYVRAWAVQLANEKACEGLSAGQAAHQARVEVTDYMLEPLWPMSDEEKKSVRNFVDVSLFTDAAKSCSEDRDAAATKVLAAVELVRIQRYLIQIDALRGYRPKLVDELVTSARQ